MMRRTVFALLIGLLPETLATAAPEKAFRPGELWPDNNGVHINAHGGGMLVHGETFYWFGQHMVEGDAGNYAQVGVHVYSSKDLYNWKDEGIALRVSDDPSRQAMTRYGGLQCSASSPWASDGNGEFSHGFDQPLRLVHFRR